MLDTFFTLNIAVALMVMMVAAYMLGRWTLQPSPRCCC
jgi:type III secretory pathway component EscV